MPPKLVKISITQGATQKNVSGGKNWATVKKPGAYAVVEATTLPNNNADEWKQIQWSGDSGEAVTQFPNRRKLSLANSKKYHLEAKLGGGSDSLDLWVLSAAVEILTGGPRPGNAAPYDSGMRDNTQNLGAVTYESVSSSVIDENAGIFVQNMGASGKIVAVATLSPAGLNQIVKDGWTFLRQVWSSNYMDGHKADSSTSTWKTDTSNPQYLKLTPDREDKIYDTDAPDLRWAQFTAESYNRFQQWIEWNGEKCSETAPWHWQARWKKDRDKNKQITLNELGKGDMILPPKAFFPLDKLP